MDVNYLIGMACEKRAIEVAVAGKHSICFIGATKSGKSILREWAKALYAKRWGEAEAEIWYKEKTAETTFCRCGYSGHKEIQCSCNDAKIKKFQKTDKFKNAVDKEIVCRVEQVRWYDIERVIGKQNLNGITKIDDVLANMKEYAPSFEDKDFMAVCEKLNKVAIEPIPDSEKYAKVIIDNIVEQDGKNLMRMVMERLSGNIADIIRTISVARTIATMESIKEIRAPHIAEAVQYCHRTVYYGF